MRGTLKRRDINWDSASCMGLDTELFFEHKTGLKQQGLEFMHLRRVCMRCPIQKECLTIASAHEQYGFWGGLSELERKFIYFEAPNKVLVELKKDLRILGVSYESIVKIVKSVERSFTYAVGNIL